MPIVAVVIMAALSGAAIQDEGPRRETRSAIRIVSPNGDGMGRLDANGDGVVTREEFIAPLNSAFDRLDTDGDGRLTAEELAAGNVGPDGGSRAVFMLGGTGGAEGTAGPGVHVFSSRSSVAGNSGGRDIRIIRRDGASGGSERSVVINGDGAPDGDAQVFTLRSGGSEGGPGRSQVFVRRFGGPNGHSGLDKDGDGRVSQEEFLAPLREAFQRMDADGDGFLDDGEAGPPPPPGE